MNSTEPGHLTCDQAAGIAHNVLGFLDVPKPEFWMVGSIRRKAYSVKDIDILCAMPRGDTDPLYDAICRHFIQAPTSHKQAGSLFDAPASALSGEILGKVVRGCKRGFRNCSVEIHPVAVNGGIKMEFWRFDAGQQGNRGWIELIRTGPWEFAKMAVTRWNRISGGKAGEPHVRYPCLRDGSRVPVPDEATAFKLLDWPYIEPENRQGPKS